MGMGMREKGGKMKGSEKGKWGIEGKLGGKRGQIEGIA